MNNNQKYRMANETEFTTLLNQANAIAGYCVTEKGTKVYGAYFTTHENGTKRVNDFPVGGQAFSKYKDVTQLVKANRGLFLPMGGRCLHNKDLEIWSITKSLDVISLPNVNSLSLHAASPLVQRNLASQAYR